MIEFYYRPLRVALGAETIADYFLIWIFSASAAGYSGCNYFRASAAVESSFKNGDDSFFILHFFNEFFQQQLGSGQSSKLTHESLI